MSKYFGKVLIALVPNTVKVICGRSSFGRHLQVARNSIYEYRLQLWKEFQRNEVSGHIIAIVYLAYNRIRLKRFDHVGIVQINHFPRDDSAAHLDLAVVVCTSL